MYISLGLSHHLAKWLAHSRYSINVCWFFLKTKPLILWALNFTLELFFPLLLLIFLSSPKSQTVPKSMVSFEEKHIDNIVVTICWTFTLCQVLCWFWMHRHTFHYNPWSKGFYRFLSVLTPKGWLRYLTSCSKEMKEAGSEPISDSKVQVFFLLYHSSRPDKTADMNWIPNSFLSSLSLLRLSWLFLFTNSPFPRILRRKVKNNFLKILNNSLITVKSSRLGLQKLVKPKGLTST